MGICKCRCSICNCCYFVLAFHLFAKMPCTRFSQAADTLGFGKSIRDGQILISEGGNFALGFFSPDGSTHRYVGIWFNEVPEQTVVWVANRLNPIPDKNSGILTISSDGIFRILESKRGNSYTIANVSSTKTPIAKLLDTGNLVLREENVAGSILWQSFGHPTDSFLPYMTLFWNKTSGENHVLTSWRSTQDPAPGDYAFGLDHNGTISIWERGVSIWNSRARNRDLFEQAPDMETSYIMNFSYMSDDRGTSFGYTTSNDSVLTRMLISLTGQWQRFSWSMSKQMWILYTEQPRRGCNISSLCGSFGICKEADFPPCWCLEGFEPSSERDWNMGVWSDGCRRKNMVRCLGNGSDSEGGTRFIQLSNVRFGGHSPRSLTIGSLEECRLLCLRNCSCSAFAFERGRCYIWNGGLYNLEQLQKDDDRGMNVYYQLATEVKNVTPSGNETGVQRDGRNKKLLWILTFALIPISTILFCFIYRRRRMTRQKDNLGADWKKDSGLHIFSFAQVASATKNFSSENKLGQGGFGPVYKGVLSNGDEIAVKRLLKSSRQGVEEFINEANLIAQVQHSNLVRLLGCCSERDENILIYEYMPNKSLDSFIFDPSRKQVLDWKGRMHIIHGIAQGLLYLHVYSRLRIIHRDLKASNILLDAEMNPKISDFGLARMVNQDESKTITQRVVGTYGYMSPEYAMQGRFSVKSDVYSFGVLLLEIISGERNSSFYQFDHSSSNLLGYAWELWQEGEIVKLIDRSLAITFPTPEIERCTHVALLCIQQNVQERPSMLEVVSMLRNEVAVLPVAIKPNFLYRRTEHGRIERSNEESSSTNDASITTLHGR